MKGGFFKPAKLFLKAWRVEKITETDKGVICFLPNVHYSCWDHVHVTSCTNLHSQMYGNLGELLVKFEGRLCVTCFGVLSRQTTKYDTVESMALWDCWNERTYVSWLPAELVTRIASFVQNYTPAFTYVTNTGTVSVCRLQCPLARMQAFADAMDHLNHILVVDILFLGDRRRRQIHAELDNDDGENDDENPRPAQQARRH